MITKLAINDDLLDEALQLSGKLTANQVATQALHEYVQRRKQLKLLDFFGAVAYDDDYDCKAQRLVQRHQNAGRL